MTECPNCGWKETNTNRQVNNIMNKYTNKKSGLEAVFNHTDKELTLENGTEWVLSKDYREYKASKTIVAPPVKPVAPTPIKPASAPVAAKPVVPTPTPVVVTPTVPANPTTAAVETTTVVTPEPTK